MVSPCPIPSLLRLDATFRAVNSTWSYVNTSLVAPLIKHGREPNLEIFSKQYECRGRCLGMYISGSFDLNITSSDLLAISISDEIVEREKWK